MSFKTHQPRVLLTGPPGVGKTTVVRRIVERLPRTMRPAGFYTEEIRVGGERRGFRAVSFDGGQHSIEHVDLGGRQRVGKYGVDLTAIDSLARTTVAATDKAALYVIDEIGRMECLSALFVAAVRMLLDSSQVVLATVACGTGVHLGREGQEGALARVASQQGRHRGARGRVGQRRLDNRNRPCSTP